MGIIHLENMEFYAFHGHFAEEQVVGNNFIVNLKLETDMMLPGKSDELRDALDYQAVYEIVAKEMKLPSKLLENLAIRILGELYNKLEGIKLATIKISKMNPPLPGKMKCVSVELTR